MKDTSALRAAQAVGADLHARYPFYRGDGSTPAGRVRADDLPSGPRSDLRAPGQYLADPGLVDACNVALLLGQPLLLTGEPGTGKTELATSLSWELELGTPPEFAPLKFETRSNSSSRELFYTYDALRRFQDAQTGVKSPSALPYLQYGPLGKAILWSRDPKDEDIAPLLPPKFQHPGPRRVVVLIDEIDKAPRDFPNDVLNELERMYFRIPELDDAKVGADPKRWPIVIITSNSEKDLPEAFLRRCVYYDIPFPDGKRLRQILLQRLDRPGSVPGSRPPSAGFLDSALEVFDQLRSPTAGLRKKPATAELLGWMLAVRDLAPPEEENPLTRRERAVKTLGSLAKTAEDQAKAMVIVKKWAGIA